MENNFFILSPQHNDIEIERFHICTWEMKNETALIEFGIEVSPLNVLPNQLIFFLYIPWLDKIHKVNDLYGKLKDPDNCRFIFNDCIENTKYIIDGNRECGTIHYLTDHGKLCFVPIDHKIDLQEHTIEITIDTNSLREKYQPKTHLYFRFYLEPNISLLTTRTRGITKTSLIYDVKVNEKRNLPISRILTSKDLCTIKTCFLFHIIPNNYELIFIDNKTCKSIRSLEFASFQKYLPHKGFKRDELIVIFNKKDNPKNFTFFSTYTKERVSPTQILTTIFINLFCAIILFLSPIRTRLNTSYLDPKFWENLPGEAYVCITVILISIIYFWGPSTYRSLYQCVRDFFKRLKNKK